MLIVVMTKKIRATYRSFMNFWLIKVKLQIITLDSGIVEKYGIRFHFFPYPSANRKVFYSPVFAGQLGISGPCLKKINSLFLDLGNKRIIPVSRIESMQLNAREPDK